MKSIRRQSGSAILGALCVFLFLALSVWFAIISVLNSGYSLHDKCKDLSQNYYASLRGREISSLSKDEYFKIKLNVTPSFNEYRDLLSHLEVEAEKGFLSTNELTIVNDHIDNKFCTPYWTYKDEFLTFKDGSMANNETHPKSEDFE